MVCGSTHQTDFKWAFSSFYLSPEQAILINLPNLILNTMTYDEKAVFCSEMLHMSKLHIKYKFTLTMFYKRKYPNDVHGMFSYMPVSYRN